MARSIQFMLFIVLGSVLLGACSSGPLRNYAKGDELAFYDFTESGSFEEGAYRNGEVRLRVAEDKYRIELTDGDGVLWWGQWGDTYTDTVIDVEVQQFGDRPEHVYGAACRMRGTVGQPGEVDPELQQLLDDDNADDTATPETNDESATPQADVTPTADEASADATPEDEDAGLVPLNEQAAATLESTDATAAPAEETPAAETVTPESDIEVANGDGYLFLIRGDGQFSIQIARGRDITPLIEWREFSRINRGGVQNNLRAVCTGDYLAFYINGELAGDVIDDTYGRGQVGLAAATANSTGVRIDFDRLSISAARSA